MKVEDLAARVLFKTGPITAMALQKVVCNCQFWNIAWTGQKLFDEPIEAWVNGPVVRSLWKKTQGAMTVRPWRGQPIANSDSIDIVVDYYGSMTPDELVALSHKEKPWLDARTGLAPQERGHREITPEAIASYYRVSLQNKIVGGTEDEGRVNEGRVFDLKSPFPKSYAGAQAKGVLSALARSQRAQTPVTMQTLRHELVQPPRIIDMATSFLLANGLIQIGDKITLNIPDGQDVN